MEDGMHKPIQDGLEYFLSGRAASEQLAAFHAHLDACGACRAEVEDMAAQAKLLRTLRPPENLAPEPGFYARVVERIEAQTSDSFWSIFMEPAFARRLMFACMALAVLLTVAAVQTPPAETAFDDPNPVRIMAGYEMPQATGEDPRRDREVVLVNLATYGSGSAPDLAISSD